MPNSPHPLSQWPVLNGDQLIVWPSAVDDRGDQLKPSIWAHRLATFAINPRARIAPDDETKLHTIASKRDAFGRDYGNVHLALARWSPAELADAIRRGCSKFSDHDVRQATELVRNLSEAAILLGPPERHQLRTIAAEKIAKATDKPDNQALSNYHTMFVLSLVGTSATQQIESLKTLLPMFRFSSDLGRFLTPPLSGDLIAVFEMLQASLDETVLTSWLGYLTCAKLPALPASKEIILSLCQHDSEAVRVAAMEVMLHVKDHALGTAFADGGWRHTAGQGRAEAIRGTMLLAQFGKHLSLVSLRERILPQALPYAIQERGNSEPEVRSLFDHLIEQLDEEISKKKRGERHGYAHFSAKDAWNKAISLDPALVLAKFHQAVEAGMMVGVFDILPLAEILSVLIDLKPANSMEIWQRSKSAHRNFNLNVGDFDWLPFKAPDTLPIRDVWRSILDDATDDLRLSDVAFHSLRGSGEAWLLDEIRKGLAAPGAGQIARSLTLAGFLDDTPAAQALWAGDVEPMRLQSWLAQVRAQARVTYDRNSFARHWLERFFATTDRDRAFAYLTLFHACADDRAVLWAPPMIQAAEISSSPEWLNLLDITLTKRQNSIKKFKDDLKKNLYFTKTSNDIAPWF